ncbi:hypothetical protein [Desertibacillus haloalkaliphilus]|uniref:hypothetical protein n=1 Tax=Desertibacillus haloalkaliphilus TaxID=1328930 RepID=UPI001C252955|nr:hypothetical protein [Desertibacillus haloalkaliphilus]MBU8906791.1 hypothetical protein [Desertibacillus haloalkaliphilus]
MKPMLDLNFIYTAKLIKQLQAQQEEQKQFQQELQLQLQEQIQLQKQLQAQLQAQQQSQKQQDLDTITFGDIGNNTTKVNIDHSTLLIFILVVLVGSGNLDNRLLEQYLQSTQV